MNFFTLEGNHKSRQWGRAAMLEPKLKRRLLQLLDPLLLPLALLHPAPLHSLIQVFLSAQLAGSLIYLQLER